MDTQHSDTIVAHTPSAGVRLLTLNKPDVLNAFDYAMYDALLRQLDDVRNNLDVRVVVLTGAGRGFCSGSDRRAPGTRDHLIDPAYGRIQRNKLSYTMTSRIAAALKSLPQPVIAAVNGPAAGIGYSLALCADLILVSSTAKFVNATHNAGSGSEMGMAYLLPRIVGLQRAAKLLLTSQPLQAARAVEWGLALEMHEPDALLPAALALAGEIAANSPIGVWNTKQAMWLSQEVSSFQAALELEGRGIHVSQATEDAREKRAAVRDKRPPRFTNK